MRSRKHRASDEVSRHNQAAGLVIRDPDGELDVCDAGYKAFVRVHNNLSSSVSYPG